MTYRDPQKSTQLTRMKLLCLVWTALLWLAIILSSYALGQQKPPFPKGTKRILFLGNSITYAGSYMADIESFIVTHYPKQHYEFIPAGLSGETVSGLSEPNPASEKFIRPDLHNRLTRVLAQTKPDVVFACYGMNDGIYLPLDETRFKAFREGMKWLHGELEKAGAKRIIFLTPPVHDDKKLGTQGYNLVLDRYADWLLAQRDSLKWEVADLHFPMKSYLEDKRKSEPGFKLANDGIHPAELGHWLMARSVLAYLGEQVGDAPDVHTALTIHPRGEEILSLVTQRKDIMKDAWLSATDPNQPARHQGLPLEKARQVYDDIERRIYDVVSNKAPRRIRIVCVGNSITEGVGLKYRHTESYPAQLQRLLGYEYEVINAGMNGKTAMKTKDNSYMATARYQEALKSNPAIVTIKLGTNDSRLVYRASIADSFITDYKTIIRSFRDLPSHPRIILLMPVASYLTDTTRQPDAVITKQIIPRIRQIAFEEKLEMIDLHSITLNRDSLFFDQLHPSAQGQTIIANRLYEAITSKTTRNFDIFPKLNVPYKVTSFYGYDCAEFTVENRTAKVVKPRIVAEGRPWVWRARFWGHEPQADIALLDRGYHIVYLDVAELYGNEEAVRLWNTYYALLTKAGLAPKAVLECMSRGGLYSYNWAARNPDKVVCVYADAPVLDIRSWPGGKGKSKGSPGDWEKFKKDYGYTTEEETLSFKNNPLDQTAALVKGKFPMLHVVGDADDIVPVDENTALFEQKIKALGGMITVIHKPGIGHHPHSLANPEPIVDFILTAVKASR